MEYKKKNILLLVSFVVMLLVSYQLAIKKTVELKKRVAIQKKELSLLSNAQERLVFLKSQNSVLDSILKSKEISIASSYEQTLLNGVTKHAKKHSLQIIVFEKSHVHVNDDFQTRTYTISVKGTFADLFSFHQDIEKDRLGIIQSVQFLKKRNYRTKKEEVSCDILIQKIES